MDDMDDKDVMDDMLVLPYCTYSEGLALPVFSTGSGGAGRGFPAGPR